MSIRFILQDIQSKYDHPIVYFWDRLLPTYNLKVEDQFADFLRPLYLKQIQVGLKVPYLKMGVLKMVFLKVGGVTDDVSAKITPGLAKDDPSKFKAIIKKQDLRKDTIYSA